MRRPAKNSGRALGMRRRTSVFSGLALWRANRLLRPGSTVRSPSVVLEMTGNSATSVAQTISAARVFFTRMMMSGAMATTGVTCSITA